MNLEAARQLVKERAYDRCEVCGRQAMTEVHHRITRGSGGVHGERQEIVNGVSNLLALDRRCHTWITGNPALAIAYGWVIERRSGLDPLTIPALLNITNGRGWWYLESDATYRWLDIPGHMEWPLPWDENPTG